MKTTSKFICLLVLGITVFACKQTKEEATSNETEMEQATEVAEQVPEVTMTKLEGSPAYEQAALVLQSPTDMKMPNGGAVDFEFDIQEYELGALTGGPNQERLANSGKGQHIHFILNNQPYSAHYEPSFSKEIPDGVHHLVAFLSRSYHESVKNANSVVVRKLEVGENPTDSLGLDMEAPTLIYSRPKGEYAGKDAENLMLDFFVLNAELSAEGYKVRATVNGKPFTITEWAPQVLRGLPYGEVTIRLELLDAQNNPVPGPFNDVTRTVTLKE